MGPLLLYLRTTQQPGVVPRREYLLCTGFWLRRAVKQYLFALTYIVDYSVKVLLFIRGDGPDMIDL